MSDNRGILYVIRDEFGAQYANRNEIPDTQRFEVTGVPSPGELPDADVLVVIHAGRDAELRGAVDQISFDRGVGSVGVELLPTKVICGPTVVPGTTACYSCYSRRIEQHSESPREYDTATSSQGLPEGFGPAHLSITNGFLALALREMRSPTADVGATVRAFDLVSGAVSSSQTVAVDNCSRCGFRFDARRAETASAIRSLP